VDSVYFDPDIDDDGRRELIYSGQLVVNSPVPGSLALIAHAQEMIHAAFGSIDPETAQFDMPVEDYAALLAELKPKFIHHPRSKECIRQMMTDLGADPEQTYFDVPRMRSSTSDNYLTTGIAYAFHPHRDTWYSAPMAQLNFWIPIFPVVPSNVMAFHPKYFDQPVKNGSWEYNYAEWNATSRQDAAKHIGTDTRKQPHAEEDVELDPQVRIITKPGGILNFSGSQFHSSVPNTSGKTRWSIDFRTVNRQDVESGRGAPNVDCDCTGTTLGDFLRLTDYEHLPAELIARHDLPSIPAPAPRHDRVSPPAVAVG
jgi:hypothetical protein